MKQFKVVFPVVSRTYGFPKTFGIWFIYKRLMHCLVEDSNKKLFIRDEIEYPLSLFSDVPSTNISDNSLDSQVREFLEREYAQELDVFDVVPEGLVLVSQERNFEKPLYQHFNKKQWYIAEAGTRYYKFLNDDPKTRFLKQGESIIRCMNSTDEEYEDYCDRSDADYYIPDVRITNVNGKCVKEIVLG